jgi:hypothetical protein
MGMSKFNLYRYVQTPKGWRYCKVVYSANGRLNRTSSSWPAKNNPVPKGSSFSISEASGCRRVTNR